MGDGTHGTEIEIEMEVIIEAVGDAGTGDITDITRGTDAQSIGGTGATGLTRGTGGPGIDKKSTYNFINLYFY